MGQLCCIAKLVAEICTLFAAAILFSIGTAGSVALFYLLLILGSTGLSLGIMIIAFLFLLGLIVGILRNLFSTTFFPRSSSDSKPKDIHAKSEKSSDVNKLSCNLEALGIDRKDMSTLSVWDFLSQLAKHQSELSFPVHIFARQIQTLVALVRSRLDDGAQDTPAESSHDPGVSGHAAGVSDIQTSSLNSESCEDPKQSQTYCAMATPGDDSASGTKIPEVEQLSH